MGSSTVPHLHSQSNTSGCIRPTSHVRCRWPLYTREGWSARCAGAQAQQSEIRDFWTSESPDEVFALSPTTRFLIWNAQINYFSPGKLKHTSALTMLAIDNLNKIWKIFSKLYISSFMFKQNMKWAKYMPVTMRRGGSTPRFPEGLLSRLTPPYFHRAQAQMSQHFSGGHNIW